MNTPAEWIALHALTVWVLLLLLALLAGDLAWQRNARWQRRAAQTGQVPTLLRWQVGVLLCLALVLFFGGLALAISGQPTTGLGSFDASLAESLRAHLPDARAQYDWSGGLIWLSTNEASADIVRGALAAAGGHATLIRAPESVRASVPIFQPQPTALAALSRRVKESFDPRSIFAGA